MNIKKKLAAVAVTGALLVSGLVGAQAAHAANGATGNLTISPTSGNVSDTYFINSIGGNLGVSGMNRSALVVYQNGNVLGQISITRPSNVNLGTYGDFGFASTPGVWGSSRTLPALVAGQNAPVLGNNYISNKQLNDPSLSPALVSGQFELRNYWTTSATGQAFDYVNDPYVSLTLTYNSTTGAWSVYTAPIATTVSLTAGTTANLHEVALSASVKDAGGVNVLSTATGTMTFNEGATVVATVPVVNGLAATTLTAVADGIHAYTATFTDGTTWASSTSGAASVTLGAITAPGSTGTTVTTAIPDTTAANILTLSGVTSSVALGTAVLQNGVLFAQGNTYAVVTDTRQLDKAGWTLTGQISDFARTGGGLALSGSYLGWVPSVSGSASNSVAGAVVQPAPTSVNGLKTVSTWATGAPFAGGTVTNAAANLQGKFPTNTPNGAYTATLTVTLS